MPSGRGQAGAQSLLSALGQHQDALADGASGGILGDVLGSILGGRR
ncbi:hypothetical protein [Serinicoccus kebangsaanensis]|nr:hypothetical protein [Serinicoccus kebangsaanensis]